MRLFGRVQGVGFRYWAADEARRHHVASPRREIVPGAIALALPACGVGPVRVRREEDAARPQRRMELAKNARQLLRGHMEERGVGEDAVEASARQIERQEILMPHLASGVGTRHGDEARRAVEPDGLVAEGAKTHQIATGATAEIEDRERARAVEA